MIELMICNPDADREEIRTVAKAYGSTASMPLVDEAAIELERRR